MSSKFTAALTAVALKYYEQKEYDKALPLFKQLAEQGNAIAQLNLGKMYFKDYGVTKDNAQAVYWFHKSAEQGNAEAKTYIDNIYINSLDEPKEMPMNTTQLLQEMGAILVDNAKFFLPLFKITTWTNAFHIGAEIAAEARRESEEEKRRQALADQEDNDK